MEKRMYNEEKLTPIFEHMAKKKVLVEGAGAIGSIICEALTRNGVGFLKIVDKDYYEIDNLPKSSFIIRYPEDLHKSKAHALADRLQTLAKEDCIIEGLNIDLQKIGPLAVSEFDYVVLALDNLAMKIFAQKVVKQCPEQKPIVLSCGTTREHSEAMIFAPHGACLRCTIPDAWLKTENPETVHSCAEVINYRLPQKTLPVVSTSGIASMKSAVDIDDMITAHASGIKSFTESERYTQTPYPNKNGHGTIIAPMDDCPVCKMEPPKDMVILKGSTMHTTLRQALIAMREYCNSEIKLKVHTLAIPGVPEQIYDQFVITENCSVCGNEFRLLKHSGDIRKTEILCEECYANCNETTHAEKTKEATYTRYFSLNDTDDDILDLTLFELGYPIGGYYEAELICENDDEHIYESDEEAVVLTIDDDFEDIAYSECVIFAMGDDRFFLIDK